MSITLNALYSLGLRPVEGGSVTSASDDKHRAITGVAGIAFPIG